MFSPKRVVARVGGWAGENGEMLVKGTMIELFVVFATIFSTTFLESRHPNMSISGCYVRK